MTKSNIELIKKRVLKYKNPFFIARKKNIDKFDKIVKDLFFEVYFT